MIGIYQHKETGVKAIADAKNMGGRDDYSYIEEAVKIKGQSFYQSKATGKTYYRFSDWTVREVKLEGDAYVFVL